MNVPLDNLYNWVEGLLPVPAIVYVFRPYGSKKISDCNWLHDYDLTTRHKSLPIIMYDQEPLDWNLYNSPQQYLDYKQYNNNKQGKFVHSLEFADLRFNYFSKFNLKFITLLKNSIIYDQSILVHSEKNSTDLDQYQQNGFLCVHYWAHALIARDWYRFAQLDSRLDAVKPTTHKFLIYCRDWSHGREYRLKFLEMLCQHQLDQVSRTSIMHTNSENVHFSQHKFLNSKFELCEPDLISRVSSNNYSSSVSADYDTNDFVETQVSVVLETVFDGSRIHLTEKTLRPIACGHPFVLAAGPGALEYIRSYGFKTFSPWINESYDSETDSSERMKKIIESIKQIQQLQGQEQQDFLQAVKQIAEFNKKHFFSNEFFDQVQNELKINLAHACDQAMQTCGRHYLELMKLVKKHKLVWPKEERTQWVRFLRQLRQSYPRDQSNHQEDLPV
jgi:hypothetical protein